MTTSMRDGDSNQPYDRYRAMSVAAVASLVFGLLSTLTAIHWFVALIPLTGVLLGALAMRQIGLAPDELTGRALARWGIRLSLLFWALGYGWLMFAQAREVPWGYQRVSYEMLQPNPDVAGEKIPPAAFELQGKKVFLVGYISPGRQQTRLKQFILCPVISNCPFCTPHPRPTEMVRVNLEGDLETDYTIHPVRVGGDFEVDPDALDGMPYRIDADYLK